MKVRCLFFASLQQAAGGSSREVELPPDATVSSLLESLEATHPEIARYRRTFKVAVDGEFAGVEQPLCEGAEVALLPPVSGGSKGLVRLTEGPVSVDECLQAVRRPDCGAVALFLGTVRNRTGEMRVERLEYSAYERMALPMLEDLAKQVRERFPVAEVALWHRTGTLEPGEISVAVAVSSGHRREAFEAARWALDTLKETVPLWKKEIVEGGAVWIEGDARTPVESGHEPPAESGGR